VIQLRNCDFGADEATADFFVSYHVSCQTPSTSKAHGALLLVFKCVLALADPPGNMLFFQLI
jgi:hypothetical protein